ncbi:MAG: hypothetical protein LUH18_05365 [Oscillospiraceae bacterium]|nr:hypothetical protein [Oscillospiraceae bacterium]
MFGIVPEIVDEFVWTVFSLHMNYRRIDAYYLKAEWFAVNKKSSVLFQDTF